MLLTNDETLDTLVKLLTNDENVTKLMLLTKDENSYLAIDCHDEIEVTNEKKMANIKLKSWTKGPSGVLENGHDQIEYCLLGLLVLPTLTSIAVLSCSAVSRPVVLSSFSTSYSSTAPSALPSANL